MLRKDIYEDCLVLYPMPVWQEELSSLCSKLKRYGEESRKIYRKFTQNANPVEMDSNGRILIPKRYLQLAGINADVRFLLGMNQKTIEIWAPDGLAKSELEEDIFKNFMNSIDE